jgi:cytochrome c-type biogenesis protein CcmH
MGVDTRVAHWGRHPWRRPLLHLVLAAAVPLAAAATWWALGEPAPAAQAEAGTPQAHYELLERQLARQPRDARARVLKARLDLQAERHELAAAGYKQALADSPKVARDPGVWLEYAEAEALRQGGRLAGPPALLIDRALALQADHPQALDLAGSADFEARRYADAAAHWQRLLGALPPDDPRRRQLAAAIADAERRARLSLPLER